MRTAASPSTTSGGTSLKVCPTSGAVTHHPAKVDKGGAFTGDAPLGERIRLHLKDGRGLNGGEEGFNLLRHNSPHN